MISCILGTDAAHHARMTSELRRLVDATLAEERRGEEVLHSTVSCVCAHVCVLCGSCAALVALVLVVTLGLSSASRGGGAPARAPGDRQDFGARGRCELHCKALGGGQRVGRACGARVLCAGMCVCVVCGQHPAPTAAALADLVARVWTAHQGDRELEEGLVVSPMMNRATTNAARLHLGLLDFVVAPLFVSLGTLLTGVETAGQKASNPLRGPCDHLGEWRCACPLLLAACAELTNALVLLCDGDCGVQPPIATTCKSSSWSLCWLGVRRAQRVIPMLTRWVKRWCSMCARRNA